MNNSSYKKIYSFLKEHNDFNLEELSEHVGLKKNTLGKYINEKLINDILSVTKKNGKIIQYHVLKLDMSENDFIKLIQQKKEEPDIELNDVERLYSRLFERSFDSFTIALEAYNRPTLKNKVEVFCILMINAWELFLKAKIIKDTNDIRAIYTEKDNDWTISLDNAVKRNYSTKDERHKKLAKHLEIMISLRDKAVHYLIEELRYALSPVFQDSINFYIEEYKLHLNHLPILNEVSGMISLIIPDNNGYAKISYIYGENAKNDIEKFLDIENQLSPFHKVEHHLYLEKKEKNADFTLSKGTDGKNIPVMKRLVPEDSYPYRFKELLRELKKRDIKIYQPELHSIINTHKIKENNEFCYKYKDTNVYKYSEAFLLFIISEYCSKSNNVNI
jgi:hypothetical protein